MSLQTRVWQAELPSSYYQTPPLPRWFAFHMQLLWASAISSKLLTKTTQTRPCKSTVILGFRKGQESTKYNLSIVILRNVGNHLQDQTASQPRKPRSTSSPPREPQISENVASFTNRIKVSLTTCQTQALEYTELDVTPIFQKCLLPPSSSTSETLVNFYQTTRRYNPEDSQLHIRRRENLKSYWSYSMIFYKSAKI
jgi:hypothetical protein